MADVAAIGKRIDIPQQRPVGNAVGRELGVLLDVGNSMKIIGVELFSCDEKTTRLLQDPPGGLWI